MHLKFLSLGAIVFLDGPPSRHDHTGNNPRRRFTTHIPPGFCRPDLNSELARVLREVNFIETEAVGQWHALPKLTLTGNPPILQNTGIASVEILGKLMNYDKNNSRFNNTDCACCHMPYAAFSGPIPSVNLTMSRIPTRSRSDNRE